MKINLKFKLHENMNVSSSEFSKEVRVLPQAMDFTMEGKDRDSVRRTVESALGKKLGLTRRKAMVRIGV